MFPDWLAVPPGSTLFIMLISLLFALFISVINRIFNPREQFGQMKAWKKEIDAWLSDYRKATRSNDKQLLAKVKKQEKRIKQLQMKMAAQSFRQMKLMPINLIFFFLIWLLVTGRILSWQLFETPFSGSVAPVAYIPWLNGVFPLDYFAWYILCSFLFGTLFNRLFGLGMGGD